MSFSITPRSEATIIKTNFNQIQRERGTQSLRLPNELIIKILHNLPEFEDRLNFSLTCREIRAIVFVEEKVLRVNQIRALLNYVKPRMNEIIFNNIIQKLHDLDEDKKLNFIKMNRVAIKIKLFIVDYIKTQFLRSDQNQNLSSIDLFQYIAEFFPREIKNVILICFFKSHPYLSNSELNFIIDYAGGYEEFRKIISLSELLVSEDDFVRYNIVSTFFYYL